MPLFRHNDQLVHYMLRGHGEAILLIHGLGSSGGEWAMQVAELEREFSLIIPDLPGCGHSSALPTGCSIETLAHSLWALIDHLHIQRLNIIGFSLGGAVALEMALQRPDSVPRLALINSLGSYLIDHWRKWLIARLPSPLVFLFGMRIIGRFSAARLFPDAWQRKMRERAALIIGKALPHSYLGLMRALEQWTAHERLGRLKCRILMIAAEHDFSPIAEKQLLASRLGADLMITRNSRHATPFDSIRATNAGLLALLTDQALPSEQSCTSDEFEPLKALTFAGSLADEHAMGP